MYQWRTTITVRSRKGEIMDKKHMHLIIIAYTTSTYYTCDLGIFEC